MSSGITTFTALKLEDKDVSDPNSGFYTTQATQEQIDAIPADAKAEGELIYNKTTGKLMLFSEGTWNTLNSSTGSNGNIVINNYPTVPSEPTEGEIYYNSTTGTLQVYLNGSWQIITTSGSGDLIAKRHSIEDPDFNLVEGLIYLSEENNDIKVAISGSEHPVSTVVTTPNSSGFLWIKDSHSDTGITNNIPRVQDPLYPHDPSKTVPAYKGIIYYNLPDNVFRTYYGDTSPNSNIARWETIYTTADSKGYLVAKTKDENNQPEDIAGGIYYNTTHDNFKVKSHDTVTNTIVTNTMLTTSDPVGYLVVKHYEDTVSTGTTTRTDPTSVQNGQIYYNTQDHAFRAYSNGAWNYFSTKPHISRYFYYSTAGYNNSTSSPGIAETTTNDAHTTLNVNAGGVDAIIVSSFLFNSYGTGGIEFTGHYDTYCTINVTMSAYVDSVSGNDTGVEFEAYKYNEQGTGSWNYIPNAKVSHKFAGDGTSYERFFNLCFTHTFNVENKKIEIRVKHASSTSDITVFIPYYSLSCVANH